MSTDSVMWAARFYGPGQPLQYEQAPFPQPADGEVVLRVRASGVCHTELHLLDGVLNPGVVPITPGHEIVGDVVECRGPNPFRPGQRVLLSYYCPCGRCRLCRSGSENLCPDSSRQIGFTADGGYAQYVVAPIASLVALPDSLTDAESVGLACGGATALHAARAVAQVQLGETVVVYGVGGVGFYLIQICRMAGARVIAIGRTRTKLDQAKILGADDSVDATSVDPLSAIYDLTHGDGADVVFDLVASAETMDLAPRMLARRGRLVFAGYGEASLKVNPLLLVLREVQIRGAVGNTLAELAETVDLAARGQLRSVVGPTFTLDRANDALLALREGRILGRAVLLPNGNLASLASREGGGKAVTTATAEGVGASPPGRITTNGRNEPLTLALSRGGRELVEPTSRPPIDCPAVRDVALNSRPPPAAVNPLVPGDGPRPFEAELLDLIGRGVDAPFDEVEFNALALGLFEYQFALNEPYRRFCAGRQRLPANVRHWTDIPAVPISAFKLADLVCEPIDRAAALFMSSGTTRPEQRSRHYHPDLTIYNASTTTNFVANVLPDLVAGDHRVPFLVLNPKPSSLPNSSLAYYLGLMLRRFGSDGSDFFVDDRGIDEDRLVAAIDGFAESGQPVCILGTTFAFVHVLDGLADRGIARELPRGSRVFDTGGVKGRSREIGRDELAEGITRRLGVPLEYQINMYGLTELSTQFLDGNLRRLVRGAAPDRSKTAPPWARARILDPDTLDELPAGSVGVICHLDLANRASVSAILTEDLGVSTPDGFEILGRVQGTEARGCSIAIDELLASLEKTS